MTVAQPNTAPAAKLKWLLGVLVLAEVFLCLLVCSSIYVNSHEYDSAFQDYFKNKTPVTEAQWNREIVHVDKVKMAIRLTTLGFLVGNTIALIWILRKVKQGSQAKTAG